MIEYHVYKYNFNAKHSIQNEMEKMHFHTFTVVLHLGSKNELKEASYREIDLIAKEFFSGFEGQYLNNCMEFMELESNLENMGEVFYEKLKAQYEERGYYLYQLDISENPLCVFQISDRILLPIQSMKDSKQNNMNISKKKPAGVN